MFPSRGGDGMNELGEIIHLKKKWLERTLEWLVGRGMSDQSDTSNPDSETAQAMTMPTAPDFESALRNSFIQAQQRGEPYIDVRAGDLHKSLGGYPGRNHRMSTCSEVMWRLFRSSDTVLHSPPKRHGASLNLRYNLPR
jgi:5-methylcytosine-specific restriction protein A